MKEQEECIEFFFYRNCNIIEILVNRRIRKQPKQLDDNETNFVSINVEPHSYPEAMKGENRERWLKMIQKKMTTLKKHKT